MFRWIWQSEGAENAQGPDTLYEYGDHISLVNPIDCITVMRYASPMQRNATPTSTPKKATRITVSLSPEEHTRVFRLAEERRVSASWVLRDALHYYLTELRKEQIKTNR